MRLDLGDMLPNSLLLIATPKSETAAIVVPELPMTRDPKSAPTGFSPAGDKQSSLAMSAQRGEPTDRSSSTSRRLKTHQAIPLARGRQNVPNMTNLQTDKRLATGLQSTKTQWQTQRDLIRIPFSFQ
jgi:hypothetical protein